jgi:hypothetical protein
MTCTGWAGPQSRSAVWIRELARRTPLVIEYTICGIANQVMPGEVRLAGGFASAVSRTFTAHDRSHRATVRLRTSRLTWRFAYTCPAKMPGEGGLTATRISRKDGGSAG